MGKAREGLKRYYNNIKDVADDECEGAIPCSNLVCKFINHVPTGKRHNRIWNANTKLAAARTSHITQMAALYGDKKWSTYVYPKQPISKGASDITVISIAGNRMYHHGEEVTSSSVSCAIKGFLSFIQQVPRPVFLAGHNIKVFDCPLLFNALKRNVNISMCIKINI
ncbi:unnamed protein product [Mytilus coruscus]|uniref:Exonuclease domain-containing protein n=1 Tax=Mytilus coruscus TaxID=42192 RepID=A0A6J8ALF1_MYTCO|nr:unnamed protein product [Mytilus coruscus]